MKHALSLILSVLLLISLLGGCANESSKTQTKASQPVSTESQEEAKTLKILIVGNSHSGDTFWLLKEVFSDQYHGDVALGYLYYSGCTISQHVDFGSNQKYVYEYSYNDHGEWKTNKSYDLLSALRDQAWDYVVLQPGKRDYTENMNLEKRRILEIMVKENVKHPYKLIWHVTWANPEEDKFFSPDWPYQKAPDGYKDYLVKTYGLNAEVQFQDYITKNVSAILSDDTYDKKICTGTAIMQALWMQKRASDEIYRDYTHLTDFARLIAAYSFYAQFTGEPITEIGIDTVPVRLRHNLFMKFGDLQITEEMKQVILGAANYALEHPWEVMRKSN